MMANDHNGAPDEIKRAKASLRRRFHAAREGVPADEREAAASACAARLFASLPLAECRVLLLYAAFGAELATSDMHERASARGIRVAYPRLDVAQRAILPVVAPELRDLAPGAFGIREPMGDQVLDPAAIDVVIVPALALDTMGRRLGYGGGYYDRFLARLTDAVPIGVTYDALIVDALPEEAHDQRVHWIVTERRTLRIDSFTETRLDVSRRARRESPNHGE